jgi:hypothetical protein
MMTPDDFKRLEQYHAGMVLHHGKLLRTFKQARLKLEHKHLQLSSKREADKILGKLGATSK